MKKTLLSSIIVSASVLAGFSSVTHAAMSPVLYQAGSFVNLSSGIYDGSTSFTDLLKNADFGLGTVNGALGEMIVYNKKVYVADSQERAQEFPLSTKTPYAMVVNFKPTQTFELKNINGIQQLENEIDAKIPSKNIMYAIKIEGTFSYMKTRAFDSPTKPYAPLDKWIAQHQHVFERKDQKAVIIGFRSPEFVNPLTVAGYHFHFISNDHKTVGHLYDMRFVNAKVSIEPIYNYLVLFPDSPEYMKKDLVELNKQVINKIEKDR